MKRYIKNRFATRKAALRCTSLLAAACLLPLPLAAQESDEDKSLSEEDVDGILVTGSRVGGIQSQSVITIDAVEIERRGIQTVDELLRQVTANTPNISSSNVGGLNGTSPAIRGQTVENLSGGSVANLRGLGPDSTLVLVNGRRIAGEAGASNAFADISSIPVDSIERIEVLTSGSSAIYGADAVGGVINIILKRNFSGVTASARYSDSSNGGDQFDASLTAGTNWGSGNITVSGTYRKEDAVSSAKFGLTTRDFRSKGGSDRRQLTSPNGVFLGTNRNSTAPDDVFRENGLELSAGFGEVDFLTDPADLNTVSRDNLPEVLPVQMSPEVETYGVSARIDQDVGLGFIESIFFDASYRERNTRTENEPAILNVEGFELAFSPFGLPDIDPFIEDGLFGPEARTDLTYSIDLRSLGLPIDPFIDADGKDYSFAGGFRGKFGMGLRWEASVNHSANEDASEVSRLTNISDVLNGVIDPDTFDVITPEFNLVRNDFATNADAAAALSRLVVNDVVDSKSELTVIDGVIRGGLLKDRSVGEMPFAFGFEHRSEELFISSLQTVGGTGDERQQTLDNNRKVFALFAEANFPITDTFIIDGAVRWERTRLEGIGIDLDQALTRFIDTGAETTLDNTIAEDPLSSSFDGWSPRIGLAWTPADIVTFKATWGQSFRAPSIGEVTDPIQVRGAFFFDPQVDPITGDPIVDGTPEVSGGNIGLQPEVADTLNVGVEFRPSFAGQDFEIEIGYFDIDYTDRIQSNFEFQGFTGPIGEPAIVRNSDGSVRYIFSGLVNFERQVTRGFDIRANHSTQIGGFVWSNRFNLSRLTKNERQGDANGEVFDELGRLNPKLNWVLVSSISSDNIEVTGTVNYTGSYIDQRFGSFIAPREVDSFTSVNLSAAYDFGQDSGVLDGIRVQLNVSNLFNARPSFVDAFNGFSPLGFDIRGRVASLRLSMRF